MNSSLAFPRSLILLLIYLLSQPSAFPAVQLSQPCVLSQPSAFPAVSCLSHVYCPSHLLSQLSVVSAICTIPVVCSQPCALSVVAVVAVELRPRVTVSSFENIEYKETCILNLSGQRGRYNRFR